MRVDGETIKALLHDEVDDTGDGIRPIRRGGATGDDLDTLDERGRNRIDIHRAGAGRTHRATSVDEHKVTARAQATQVDDRSSTVARVVRLRTRARHNLRQGVEVLLNRRVTALDDRILINRQDRTLGNGIALGDTRTGDDDLIETGVGLLSLNGRGGRDRHGTDGARQNGLTNCR